MISIIHRSNLNVPSNDMQFYSILGEERKWIGARAADRMTEYILYFIAAVVVTVVLFIEMMYFVCVLDVIASSMYSFCAWTLTLTMNNDKKKRARSTTQSHRAFPCVHAFCFRFIRGFIVWKNQKIILTTRGSRLCRRRRRQMLCFVYCQLRVRQTKGFNMKAWQSERAFEK